MSDNELVFALAVAMLGCFAFFRFLEFITDMARIDEPPSGEPKESAWDDEL